MPPMGKDRIPYPLSPQFGSWFEEGIRKYIVPAMIKSRRVKMLSESVNMDEMGRAGFFELFDRPPKENIIRNLWEDRWTDFRTILNPPKQQAAKKKEEKKGLFGKLGKKQKAPVFTGPKVNPEIEKDAKAFWKLLKDHAEEGNYDPPKPSEIEFFKVLFEYEPDKIQVGMQGLKQMLHQEAMGGEDGREGASRMYIDRQINMSAAHCGELVALWAYYTCRDDFTVNITKSFLASQGTSATERKARLPFFMRWVPDVVANPPKDKMAL